MRTITVSEETWEKLTLLKLKTKKSSIDQVIKDIIITVGMKK